MMSLMNNCVSHFHYHRLSSEESNNTLIPQIIELGKVVHLHIKDFVLDSVIGLSYGKRLIITGERIILNNIKREDIIEIIDVDPVKKQVLYFGSASPARYTPLLYMIHYAKTEIQFLLFFSLKERMEKQFRLQSASQIKDEKTFMDLMKSILTSLQTHENIIINSKYLIITSLTKQRIEKTIEQVGEIIENKWSG